MIGGNSGGRHLNASAFVVAGCAFLALVLSLCIYMFSNVGNRRVFMFEPVAGGKLSYEVRYLPLGSAQGDLQFYVDELLLGAVAPSCKLLFPAGTSVRSCFVHNRALYLDLSEEALQVQNSPAVTNWGKSFEILQKNLFTNFTTFDTIHLYICGREVFSETSAVNAM